MTTSITILAPDDFHHHLRDEDPVDQGVGLLSLTCRLAAKQFERMIIMPNLKPPVRTLDDAIAYRKRIEKSLQGCPNSFDPMMTLYLTDNTSPQDIREAKASGIVKAAKLYPAGATTNSEFGVTSMEKIQGVLEAMADCGMVLCIHGEVTDKDVDIFDRERIFIEKVLKPLVSRNPDLRIVMEHCTTAEMVKYVESAGPNIGATITAHHLLYNRNALFSGGICPHYYCLPILKREIHRQALLKAATSGNPKFFIGTDSAPHVLTNKHSACGCAGVFTGHAAIELYAEAFDSVGAIDKLEGFASIHGAAFYGLPQNTRSITLVKEKWEVQDFYQFVCRDVSDEESKRVRPLRAGETIAWKMAGMSTS